MKVARLFTFLADIVSNHTNTEQYGGKNGRLNVQVFNTTATVIEVSSLEDVKEKRWLAERRNIKTGTRPSRSPRGYKKSYAARAGPDIWA